MKKSLDNFAENEVNLMPRQKMDFSGNLWRIEKNLWLRQQMKLPQDINLGIEVNLRLRQEIKLSWNISEAK